MATALTLTAFGTQGAAGAATSTPQPTPSPSATTAPAPSGPDTPLPPGLPEAKTAPEIQALTAARAGKKPVTVDALTTPTSMTVANPDGTLTATVNPLPVRAKVNGAWGPIDLGMAKRADGTIGPKAAPHQGVVASAGSRQLQSVQAGPTSVGFSWPRPLPDPVLSGPTARYREVLPGVDLLVTAQATGMETSLVVTSRPAAPLGTVELAIDAGGLALSQDAHGNLEFRDSSGAVAVFSTAPKAWDSSRDARSDLPRLVSVDSRLAGTAAAPTLQIAMPDAFLADQVTVFPVTIDPPTTTVGTSAYTYIDSGFPTTSYYMSNWDPNGEHVGTFNGGGNITRALYALPASGLLGKNILGAHFDTWLNYSWSCSPTTVNLYHTNPWDSSVTWNTQPANGGPWASASAAKGYNSSCAAGAVSFDATSLVSTLVSQGWGTYYLMLVAGNEYDNYGWKKFANNPTLTVQYNTPPGVPTSTYVTPCGFTCSGVWASSSPTPRLWAAASDADGDNLSYGFEVYAGTPTAVGALKASGANGWWAQGTWGYWDVNTSLTDGDYVFRTRTGDGTVLSGWSAYKPFVVDTTKPAAPTVATGGALSTTPGSFTGAIGVTTGTITITPAAGTAAYVYAIRGGGSSPSAPTDAPACGQTLRGYTWVCATTPTTSTIAAVDKTTFVDVWAIDNAGNTGATAQATTKTFYTGNDPNVAAQGHGWSTTDAYGTPCLTPATIDDTTNSTTPKTLTLSGTGLCWANLALAPTGYGTYSVLNYGAGNTAGAATTGSPALVDTSKSFTVGAWLRVPTATAGYYRTALAQDGTNQDVFYLQNSGARWTFCMSNSDATAYAGDCAFSAATVPVNTWVYVAGIWDAVNHQIRLHVSTSTGEAGTPVVASHATSWTANGPCMVGRDKIGAAYRFWEGQIADITVLPGVASTYQLTQLGRDHAMPPTL